MQWQISLVLGRARSNTTAAATAAHPAAIMFLLPQVYSLCASQCTLSDANSSAGKKVPWRKIKHDSSSDRTDRDPADSKTGCTPKEFDAADANAAKAELLRFFGHLHANGRVRCINSRANYVYCKCSKCGATAAATASKTSAGKWTLSQMSAMASSPCTGFFIKSESPSVSTNVSRDTSSISVFPFPGPPPPPLLVAAPPYLSVVPIQPRACSICESSHPLQDMFECPNPAKHLMCQDCFENNITSQIQEDLLAFTTRNCTIFCGFCACLATAAKAQPTLPFNMKAL